MSTEATLVRIYISESDSDERGNLMEDIMRILHDEHQVHGVTVFRGISGFGSKGIVRAADLLRLSPHLPEVVEFFDEPSVVDTAIDALRPLVPAGHIISWRVRMI